LIEITFRILSLCLLLACTETLHGIVRAALLVPRIGKKPALKVSIVTGSLLAFGVCYWYVPTLGINSTAGLLGLGFLLALFMASFDAALGRMLLHLPWKKIARDFNPASGNYLLFGLLLLAAYPWLIMRL